MNRILLTLIAGWVLLLLPLLLKAQSVASGHGSVEIICDSRLDQLLEKHRKINQAFKTMNGFRIQLLSESGNNSKAQAQMLQEELKVRFPDAGVYLSFKSPNYRVRLGDFRTRLDAQRYLMDILIDYPQAFIVNDLINLP